MKKISLLLCLLLCVSALAACGDDGDDGNNNPPANNDTNNDVNNDMNNDVNNDMNNDVNNDVNNDENNDVDPVAECQAVCDNLLEMCSAALEESCPFEDARGQVPAACDAACEDDNGRAQITAAAGLPCDAVIPLAIDGFGLADACQGLRGKDNPPTLGDQIDRTGRPAINTALNDTFNGDDMAKGAAKDAYNAAGPDGWGAFSPAFEGSLAILDSLDTVCGNQLLAGETPDPGRYSALAGILADDQLYVNTGSGTCGVYLGLEAEIVGAVEAGVGGCGGRTLDDDIIERSYSVLAAGILEGVDDTIAENDVANSPNFPFVASPSE